jgi:hypothetical protein
LIAVDRGLASQKEAKDQAELMTSIKEYQAHYAMAWVAVKLNK